MLWACILLPQLALDSVLRRLPDPEKPLALVSGPVHLRSLHAVNASAAQAGLKPGMRLSAAHALLAEVATVVHDTQAEARWHRFLAAWAYRHSSLVSAQWPGCVVLEARASFRLLGPWPRFEARLREELGALGFSHRIALAPTPRAARVLAGLRDGLAVTSSKGMQELLARVPVRRAALPEDSGQRLHRMGVRDLGALRALPRDSLRRRFGLELLEHVDRLYGEADDPLEYYAPPDHFDNRIELGYEIEHHPPLLFPLRRLINDLCTYLSIRDGGVQRFVLKLEHEQGHTDVEVGLLAAGAPAGDAVRAHPQPAGARRHSQAGAGDAPAGARTSAVRAGLARSVRHPRAAVAALATAARTPARAPGRRSGISGGTCRRPASGACLAPRRWQAIAATDPAAAASLAAGAADPLART